MYKIDEKDRLSILSQASLKAYPESAITEEIEKAIAATLPFVPGLIPGLSEEERNEIISADVDKKRKRFIVEFGDDLG